MPNCVQGSTRSVMPSSRSARTTAAPRPVPTAMPSSAPKTEITTASTVTIHMVRARLSPIARSSPSSRVRSSTDRASVFTMPEHGDQDRQRQQDLDHLRMESNWPVCCSMNDARSATDTSGLSASSASTFGSTWSTEVPGVSCR